MSRTQKNKILYLATLTLGSAIAATVGIYFGFGLAEYFLLAVVLISPGRIGGYVLRDLFKARRLVDNKKYEEAITVLDHFLKTLDQQPWRQYFMYCFFGLYTWNTRAMALNNMGSARMELGHLDKAEKLFREALGLDDEFPLPYHNLAILAAVRGDNEQSNQFNTTAQQLGYKLSSFDKAVSRVGSAYSKYQTFP